jgi:predicted esterase
MRFHHPTAILATVVLICGTVDAVHAQYRRATPRTQPTQILEIEGARHIAPATVDRAVQEHLQDHTVLMPEQPRGTLLLWLAGSGAKVDYYTELMKTGRDLGYHVIGLSYANDPSLIQICARAPERDCFRDARLEKITGNDVSNRTRVSRADSIEERLVRLLDYLDAEYPDEGWDRFANRNDIDWSRIAVAGHSQGGGNAAMIGQMHAVQRVVMFSSPSDHNWSTGALAPWTSDRFATPADRFFGISHTGERNHEQHLAHWEAIGLTRYGGPTRLDERTPPYGGAHVLTTGIAPVVNNYHVAPVGDAELTRMSNGEPVMREAWAYLLGGEDARLPVYVADEGARAAEPSPSQTTRGDTVERVALPEPQRRQRRAQRR